MPVEYISTMDPQMAALVGAAVGIWMPDRYSNDIVNAALRGFVSNETGKSPNEVRDDLLTVDRNDTEPETADDEGENR